MLIEHPCQVCRVKVHHGRAGGPAADQVEGDVDRPEPFGHRRYGLRCALGGPQVADGRHPAIIGQPAVPGDAGQGVGVPPGKPEPRPARGEGRGRRPSQDAAGTGDEDDRPSGSSAHDRWPSMVLSARMIVPPRSGPSLPGSRRNGPTTTATDTPATRTRREASSPNTGPSARPGNRIRSPGAALDRVHSTREPGSRSVRTSSGSADSVGTGRSGGAPRAPPDRTPRSAMPGRRRSGSRSS